MKVTRAHYKLIEEFNAETVAFNEMLPYLERYFPKGYNKIIESLEARGESGSTVLHVLVDGWTKPSNGKNSLFDWLMKTYPTLYMAADRLGRNILERVRRRSTSSAWSFTEYFVARYNDEALQLIKEKPQILNSLLSTLSDTILWERLLDGLDEETIRYKNDEGNTFLHDAALFDWKLPSDDIAKRCSLLSKTIQRFPETLLLTNYNNESVYQHRMRSGPADSEDTISFLLMDEILHLEDRQLIRKLLRSDDRGWQP